MWELDYDGALLLRIPAEGSDAFVAGSFYKLSLKRYVKETLPGFVRFKPALTYLDYKKVVGICRKEAEKRQIVLQIASALREYIESREMHIELRSRLGIELKDHDAKLQARFDEYKEIVDAGMARKLRDRQMWDSFFMCAMQKSANFSVPGSGKTASVLGMYAFLRQKELARRIVVVCPKNAFGSWMDEFSVCFKGIEQLHVLNIHNPIYKNTKQRLAALQYDAGRCNLILVNYESVGSVLDGLLQLVDQNTLLAFDEVHKIKRVNGEYAEQSLRLARNASYVVAMTGTPIPNAYTDIYNLLHVLFPDEYDEFFDFSVPMLRKPHPDEVGLINDKLQPFFCRTTKDQLGVPKANSDILCDAKASDDENRLLRILQMKYRKNKLALLIRILQMESDPQMLLRSLDLHDFAYLLDDAEEADSIDFADYSEEVKALIDRCSKTTKFNNCVNQTRKLVAQGKTVIIWCMFVDSINRLAQELKAQGIAAHCIYGEIPLDERLTLIQEFKEGKIQVLLTNPHTLAESVSLHSVCHDAVYFEYSYNLVHLLQSKDRIHRLGLPDNQYTQYYYHRVFYNTDEGPWSLDEAIYNRLLEKEQIMLDAIANRKLEVMPTSNEDLDIIFGKMNNQAVPYDLFASSTPSDGNESTVVHRSYMNRIDSRRTSEDRADDLVPRFKACHRAKDDEPNPQWEEERRQRQEYWAAVKYARKQLYDYYGTASHFFRGARSDLMRISEMEPDEILEEARRNGLI